ncbi:MAG: DUF1638 domain-containing protein [Chloroflexi bacterium]|nr:DUF1638 domain-containing protein [Chloroflexota bacterium]
MEATLKAGYSSRRRLGDSKAAGAIITCGILRDELEAVVRDKGLDYPVFYLAPAPCINYDRLEKQLDVLLRRAAAAAEKTLVVIGRCHPDIDHLLGRYNAGRLPMNNCFEALLGASRMRELLNEATTFFTTPSWLKHWRRAVKQGMKWDETDARQNFGVNQRILVLDAGVTPYTDEEVLAFFDFAQIGVEIVPIDLAAFATLLMGELEKLGILPAEALLLGTVETQSR